MKGHTAPPNNLGDSDPVSRPRQNRQQKRIYSTLCCGRKERPTLSHISNLSKTIWAGPVAHRSIARSVRLADLELLSLCTKRDSIAGHGM
jgi:hypothetical protein